MIACRKCDTDGVIYRGQPGLEQECPECRGEGYVAEDSEAARVYRQWDAGELAPDGRDWASYLEDEDEDD